MVIDSGLREKIAALVTDIAHDGDEDYSATVECHRRIADAIMAIPEIKEALELLGVSGPLQTAHRYLLIGQPDDAFRVVDKFLASALPLAASQPK